MFRERRWKQWSPASCCRSPRKRIGRLGGGFSSIFVDDAIETLPELVGRAEDTLRHYSVPERPAFVTGVTSCKRPCRIFAREPETQAIVVGQPSGTAIAASLPDALLRARARPVKAFAIGPSLPRRMNSTPSGPRAKTPRVSDYDRPCLAPRNDWSRDRGVQTVRACGWQFARDLMVVEQKTVILRVSIGSVAQQQSPVRHATWAELLPITSPSQCELAIRLTVRESTARVRR